MSVIFWNLLNISKNTYKDFFFKKKSNYYFYFLILLIFLQIIMGAFVSGLDAGKIYQTWPLMNDGYFPNDVIILKVKDLFNFNDHSLVQFYHRNIAYIISIYIIISGIIIYKKNIRKLFKAFYIVSIILILQIFLGIFTLLSGLNIFLASAHQITSLLLVLSVINLHYNSIK